MISDNKSQWQVFLKKGWLTNVIYLYGEVYLVATLRDNKASYLKVYVWWVAAHAHVPIDY